MNYKKIVIAVDFDQSTLSTLSLLKDNKITQDAEIHLIHVYEYNFLKYEWMQMTGQGRADLPTIEKKINQSLTQVKDKLGLAQNKVIAKCLVGNGVRQDFLQYIDQQNPDLVIAASQEKEGFKGFFESSFTAFLNKFCRTDILIMRPR